MEKKLYLKEWYRLFLLAFSILIAFVAYIPSVKAATIEGNSPNFNGAQLAWHYYYGTSPRYRDRHHNDRYYPGGRYPTSWYASPRCKNKCYVDRWGNAIQCRRVCW